MLILKEVLQSADDDMELDEFYRFREQQRTNEESYLDSDQESDLESDFYIDYSELDDFQRLLIDRKNNRSLVVSGSAGSGKSLIALHKAKQIAASGESYSVIVYTKTLRKYFQDGLRGLNPNKVYSYHAWKRLHREKVTYLIVDECQDFTSQQINEFRASAKYCLFFGDTAQSIMGFNTPTMSVEDIAHWLDVPADPLYFNYRLTRPIAKLGETVGRVDDLEIRCKRDGEKPNLISASTFDEQLDKIVEAIRNRSLNNVGILLPYNRQQRGCMSVEYVKNYLNQRGIECEYKYNETSGTEMNINFKSRKPKIMTWWSAKGLQFKDVFIPGCETNFDSKYRAALFVAMTRSSERLYLLYSGSLSSFFPDPSSSLYNTPSDDVDLI